MQNERIQEALVELAARIRQARERKGLTQEAFAVKCGISVSFASLLERGARAPSYETLLQIAEALEVGLHELVQDPETAAAENPVWAALKEFAERYELSNEQVGRLLAVGRAMFDPAENCLIAKCRRPVLAKSLCAAHYHQARRKAR